MVISRENETYYFDAEKLNPTFNNTGSDIRTSMREPLNTSPNMNKVEQ